MRKPEPIDKFTTNTTTDHVATILFWGIVLGFPLFIVVWRLSH